jgi:hypothetical protein
LPWRPRRDRPIPYTHCSKPLDDDISIDAAFFLVYPCQYGARWCSRDPFTVQTIFRPEAPMPAYPRTKTESRCWPGGGYGPEASRGRNFNGRSWVKSPKRRGKRVPSRHPRVLLVVRRPRSGTDPPVTVNVRLAAGAEPAPFWRNVRFMRFEALFEALFDVMQPPEGSIPPPLPGQIGVPFRRPERVRPRTRPSFCLCGSRTFNANRGGTAGRKSLGTS